MNQTLFHLLCPANMQKQNVLLVVCHRLFDKWCVDATLERPNVQLTVYVFVYSVNIFFHAFYDQNTLVNVNVIVLV